MHKSIGEALLYTRPSVADNLLGKGFRGFEKGGVVEKDKGGQRGVGLRSFCGTFLPARGIKCFEHGVKKLSLPVYIESASAQSFPFVGLVFSRGEVKVAVVSNGLQGLYTGTSNSWDEQTTYGQGVVANKLGGQATGNLVGMKAGRG